MWKGQWCLMAFRAQRECCGLVGSALLLTLRVWPHSLHLVVIFGRLWKLSIRGLDGGSGSQAVDCACSSPLPDRLRCEQAIPYPCHGYPRRLLVSMASLLSQVHLWTVSQVNCPLFRCLLLGQGQTTNAWGSGCPWAKHAKNSQLEHVLWWHQEL